MFHFDWCWSGTITGQCQSLLRSVLLCHGVESVVTAAERHQGLGACGDDDGPLAREEPGPWGGGGGNGALQTAQVWAKQN